MTYALYCLLAGGLCCSSAVLFLRLRNSVRFAAQHVRGTDASDPLALAVTRLMANAIDASLAPTADRSGLARVEILFREPQDPYRYLAELVTRIGGEVSSGASDPTPLVKYLYQFQSTLGGGREELDECLKLLAARVSDGSPGESPSIRVEMVRAGDLLDGTRMIALTRGTRVKQPLGFIVVGADGEILLKARVICE